MANGLYGGGDGSLLDPYIIEDEMDLRVYMEVNDGSSNIVYGSIINNIDIKDSNKINMYGYKDIEGNGVNVNILEVSGNNKFIDNLSTINFKNITFNASLEYKDTSTSYIENRLFYTALNKSNINVNGCKLNISIDIDTRNNEYSENIVPIFFSFKGIKIIESYINILYNCNIDILGNGFSNRYTLLESGDMNRCLIGINGDVNFANENTSNTESGIDITIISWYGISSNNGAECIITNGLKINITDNGRYKGTELKFKSIDISPMVSQSVGKDINSYMDGNIDIKWILNVDSSKLDKYDLDDFNIATSVNRVYINTYIKLDIINYTGSLDIGDIVAGSLGYMDSIFNMDRLIINNKSVSKYESFDPSGLYKSDSEMLDINTYLNEMFNFDLIWGIDTTINNGYPYLLWYPYKTESESILKIQGDGEVIEIPLYNISDMKDEYIVISIGGDVKKAVKLVAIGDSQASAVKVMTSNGVMCLSR